jgi:hypothetical protein
VAAVVAVVLACGIGWIRQYGVPLTERDKGMRGFVVENHLEGLLAVEIDRGGGPVVYEVLGRNSVDIPLNRTCGTAVRLVASDARRREVARLDDPLCEERTWVIEADGATRVLPGRRPFPR